MASSMNFGEFSRSQISDVPADLTTPRALHYKQTIPRFPEEAVYIYSFHEGRMIYADGWEEVLGYRDEEISMLLIVNSSTPAFAPFSNELNDKALQFILSKNEDLDKYSFSIELKKTHKQGHEVPIVARVGVYEAVQGRVVSIIGRFLVNRSITFGKVMRYAAYGPEKQEFEEELNKSLFYHLAISDKEREALALAAGGYSFKKIAKQLKISVSAVEKRINPLYERFKVENIAHLVSFAKDNHILS
ncbi:MAG: helix-turn-helix transcriptional regulator [Chitinophagaceae bacterium]|nr:helix-turn-helix transcriptional regulator [Chitinophagaceae bacterium]